MKRESPFSLNAKDLPNGKQIFMCTPLSKLAGANIFAEPPFFASKFSKTPLICDEIFDDPSKNPHIKAPDFRNEAYILKNSCVKVHDFQNEVSSYENSRV